MHIIFPNIAHCKQQSHPSSNVAALCSHATAVHSLFNLIISQLYAFAACLSCLLSLPDGRARLSLFPASIAFTTTFRSVRKLGSPFALQSTVHEALCRLHVDEDAVKSRQHAGAILVWRSEAINPSQGLHRRQKLLEVSSNRAGSPVGLKKLLLSTTVGMATATTANLVQSAREKLLAAND